MSRRKFTNQADGSDRSKMPRTGTGDAPRGGKPRPDQLAITNRDGDKQRTGQPKGWGIGRVLGFGKKQGPGEK